MTDPVAQIWRPDEAAERKMESDEAAGTAHSESGADHGVGGLLADVRRLLDDGRTLAAAEFAYQSTRAAVAASAARSIAIYGVIAAVFVLFALIALTVGLLLALTPLVTAWGATAIVAGGYALAAFVLATRASRRWQRAKAVLTDPDAAL